MNTYFRNTCRIRPLGIAIWLIITVGLVNSTEANAFRNPPPSASGLAQDGGKIAFIEDASAVAINPANLVDVKRSLQFSLTSIYGESKLSTPFGSSRTKNSCDFLPNIFGVTPLLDGTVVAGAGLSTPFGQSVEWPQSSPLARSSYYSRMRVVDLGLSLATRVTECISIGGGMDLYWSDIDLRSTTHGVASVPGGRVVKLTGDGTAIGGNIGMTWQMTEKQRLALTYRLPFRVTYEGDTDIYAPGVPSSEFETEIDFPAIAVIGYGIQLTDTLRLATDVEWVQFSNVDSLPMDYGMYNRNPAFATRRKIEQNWNDIWTVGMSAAWQITDVLTLRGTYKYMPSPIPDETLAPSLPDADYHLVGAGFGWHSKYHSIDVSYMYNFAQDRKVLTGGIVPTSYKINSQLLSMTYRWCF